MGWNKAGQSMEESGGNLHETGSYKEIETIHVVSMSPETHDPQVLQLIEEQKTSPPPPATLNWGPGSLRGNLSK